MRNSHCPYCMAYSGCCLRTGNTAGITHTGDTVAFCFMHGNVLLAVYSFYPVQDCSRLPFCPDHGDDPWGHCGQGAYPGGFVMALYGGNQGQPRSIIYHIVSYMDKLG